MKNKHLANWTNLPPAAGLQKQKGQSMVELSIAFIVLLMLLAGVIDMGRAFFTYSALQDAAQEGAAYASTQSTQQRLRYCRFERNSPAGKRQCRANLPKPDRL